jgi:hypothetical protein
MEQRFGLPAGNGVTFRHFCQHKNCFFFPKPRGTRAIQNAVAHSPAVTKAQEMSARFRPRALLSEQDAVDIYLSGKARSFQKLNSVQLSKQYRVSPKTIRDIWNRRTWAPETKHLWAENEIPLLRRKQSGQSIKSIPKNSRRAASGARWSGYQRLLPGHITSHIPHYFVWLAFENLFHKLIVSRVLVSKPVILHPPACPGRSEPACSLQADLAAPCDAPPTDPGAAADADADAAAFAMAAADDPFHSDWPHW